jgi:hypothetical protein
MDGVKSSLIPLLNFFNLCHSSTDCFYDYWKYVLPVTTVIKEAIPRDETFVIYRELCLRYKEIFRQQQLEEFLVGNFPHDRYGNVPRKIELPVMN